ncbi:MAG: ABC transporter permease [Acidobacteria bacterium]|nr:ABC transporter permease [Acidobacteriota bacterium]
MLQDLRYAFRMLLKSSGFTAVAVLTLALGIGANSAIFSVVTGVLLKPLAYHEPSRLVMVFEHNQFSARDNASPANFLDWREQNKAFVDLAATARRGYVLTSVEGRSAAAERLQGAAVSASLFPMLGVSPVRGRNFLPEDDRPEANRAVILSYRLWQRSFGADPDLIGKALTLDGEKYTVVGVMPAAFQFPDKDVELWMPIEREIPYRDMHWRGSHYLSVVGRLKPDVLVEQARDEMTSIALHIKEAHPDELTPASVSVVPLQEYVVGEARRALMVLLGAVAFVLLIACVNVANLLLARATARAREIAIRSALGAGRRRLVRQLLTESVLLSLAGGILGVILAQWGTDALIALGPDTIPRASEVRVDGWVLAFTLAVSVLTGLLFGIVPALAASKTDVHESLKEGGRTSAGGGRLRSSLVVAEIALSLVLMIGAGLLVASFGRLLGVDPGIHPDNVLTLRLALADPPYDNRAVFLAFYRRVQERLKTLPGVEAAAAINSLPLTPRDFANTFSIPGRPPLLPGEFLSAEMRWVSPDYFRVMGIPLLKGRTITDRDTEETPRVVVISETMARRWWPNEDPLGKRISIAYGGEFVPEIVGVAGDVRNGLDLEPLPYMYVAYTQLPRDEMYLVARFSGTLNAATLAGMVRREVQALDKDIAVYRVRTMEQVLAVSVGERRFHMLLLGVFASLAMALAAVGIYGVTAYGITQRTREIGLRMALGARRRNVVGMLIGQAMTLAGAGVALGLAGAFALTRFMSGLLFGVTATDPQTFALVSLLLAAVVLAASYIPARRAAQLDPMAALRYE